MQNLAAFVFNDKEAIQYAERQRRNRKEIECSNHVAVILQKCQPVLLGITTVN
jgi:hypothetical protein